MGEPPKGHGLQSEQFMTNPLVIIAPPDHKLLQKTNNLTINDLEGEKFVVREKGSGTRECIERYFKKSDNNFTTTFDTFPGS